MQKNSISWLWIILGFIFVWPVGLVLLFVKLFGGQRPAANRQSPRTYQSQGGPRYTTQYSAQKQQNQAQDWRQNAQTVEHEPVTQTPPPPPRRQARTYNQAPPTYSYNYNYAPPPKSDRAMRREDERLRKKIAPSSGKGLRIAGWIVVGSGVLASAITFLGITMSNWWYYTPYDFLQSIIITGIIVLSVCVPGLAMLIPGIQIGNRSERCQTFHAMMQGRRYVKIKDLAAAVPCTYGQAVKDLRWMIHEGFFPGAYIDAGKRIVTYSGAEVEVSEPERRQQAAPEPEKPAEPAKKPGVFAEVERIHQIDAEIDDEFVSEQIIVLAELTQKIFTYVEQNPGKEDRISQFRNHYLPKTIKILESYARFEKQGVKGANIRAAMRDVEEIMETLVSGFEKQLDMLFLDEALDVSTDINVLESMMGLTGLSSDDPFKLELMGEEE